MCSLLTPPEDMGYRWKVQFIRTCMILGVIFTFYVCGCLVPRLHRLGFGSALLISSLTEFVCGIAGSLFTARIHSVRDKTDRTIAKPKC